MAKLHMEKITDKETKLHMEKITDNFKNKYNLKNKNDQDYYNSLRKDEYELYCQYAEYENIDDIILKIKEKL